MRDEYFLLKHTPQVRNLFEGVFRVVDGFLGALKGKNHRLRLSEDSSQKDFRISEKNQRYVNVLIS